MSDDARRNKDLDQDEAGGSRVIDPTIVGGRPVTRETLLKGIPRGIEVLIKKASVDPGFRSVLLEKRAKAADDIELGLSPTETAMLNAIPAAQIEKIITNTAVPAEHRRVFLGKAAAAMLSLLAGFAGLHTGCVIEGSRPDHGQPVPPIGVSGVKVPLEAQRIAITPKDKGPGEVEVLVAYQCPFDSGDLTLSFRSDLGFPGKTIRCRPDGVLVAQGNHDVTFHANGKVETTQWILVKLTNKSGAAGSASSKGSSVSNKFQPGEFVEEDRVITHIIEFSKTWEA